MPMDLALPMLNSISPLSSSPTFMAGYVSETTLFLREFLDKNPQVVEKQKKHRATWWDRPQDFDELKKLEESKIDQQPYVYYNKP